MAGLIEELNRRNVFRVAAAYVVIGWLVLQVNDVLFDIFAVPEWVSKVIVILIALGLIPTLLFSWAYEITPEGIKKESEIERSESITHHTAKKLDIITIVVVILAIGVYLGTEFIIDKPLPTEVVEAETQTQKVNESFQSQSNGRISIAVLPFDNLSDNSENQYFASGVQEDILTLLSKINALRVTSRSSVEMYRTNRPSIREISQKLKVDHILEGSVRRVGNRVRVTAQLIAAQSDEHLWAENYDRELTDVFAIQTEIAKKISQALQTQLSPEEELLINKKPTENLVAYDLYLKARAILNGPYTATQDSEALPLIQQALQLDPNFIQAQVMLADIYGGLYWKIEPTAEFATLMKNAVDKAVALDNNSAQAHEALGEYFYRVETDFQKAFLSFNHALTIEPNNTSILLKRAFTERRLGLWEQSLLTYDQILELEPTNQNALLEKLANLMSMRRWREAEELIQVSINEYGGEPELTTKLAYVQLYGFGNLKHARSLYESIPDSPSMFYLWVSTNLPLYERDYDAALKALFAPGPSRWFNNASFRPFRTLQIGNIHYYKGNQDKAKIYWQETIDIANDFLEKHGNKANYATWVLITKATAQASLGEKDLARKNAELAQKIMPISKNYLDGIGIISASAKVYALVGDTNQAFELMRYSLNSPSGMNTMELALDPSWDFMRDNPEFVKLSTQDPINSIGTVK